MKRGFVIFLSGLTLSLSISMTTLSQEHPIKGMHEHTKQPEKMVPKSTLKPAEGANVKILSPHSGQMVKGDEVHLRYKFAKGKRGAHLHAYIDGELMGMFSHPERGTLTGIQPGPHSLEVRVVAEDHVTELDATDKVHFLVK